MGVSEEVRDIEREATSLLAKGRALAASILNPYRDALALFYDGDDLKPAAVRWLERLAIKNFVDRSAYDDDPRRHAFNEGRRAAVLEILDSLRLDSAKLARVTRQMREIEHG